MNRQLQRAESRCLAQAEIQDRRRGQEKADGRALTPPSRVSRRMELRAKPAPEVGNFNRITVLRRAYCTAFAAAGRNLQSQMQAAGHRTTYAAGLYTKLNQVQTVDARGTLPAIGHVATGAGECRAANPPSSPELPEPTVYDGRRLSDPAADSRPGDSRLRALTRITLPARPPIHPACQRSSSSKYFSIPRRYALPGGRLDARTWQLKFDQYPKC